VTGRATPSVPDAADSNSAGGRATPNLEGPSAANDPNPLGGIERVPGHRDAIPCLSGGSEPLLAAVGSWQVSSQNRKRLR